MGDFSTGTGNGPFDASRSSPDESENLVDLLLAFPPGDFFCDRVFEIWCLHQVIESFRRCGAVIADGPRPLSERSDRPICAMHYEGYTSKIWFQKALPTSAAKWKYVYSQKSPGSEFPISPSSAMTVDAS